MKKIKTLPFRRYLIPSCICFLTIQMVVGQVPTFPFTDTDGDSYRDEAETAFGSDPNDASSIPDHTNFPAAPTKPNIVIIYTDDMGFGDVRAYTDFLGVANSPSETPNIDALIAESTMFTQGHSSSAVCTPSRYALLTGTYHWRRFYDVTRAYGIEPTPLTGITTLPGLSEVTIAEFLKTQNYDTAAFGKWHLGGRYYYQGGNTRVSGNNDNSGNVGNIDWARPVEQHAVSHGFDIFQGPATAINFPPYAYLKNDRLQFWDTALNGGAGAYRNAKNTDPFRWWSKTALTAIVQSISGNGSTGGTEGAGDPSYRQLTPYGTPDPNDPPLPPDVGDQLVIDIEAYLANQASSNNPDPFFLYISMHSPHKPYAVSEAFKDEPGNSYVKFMKECDADIGRFLQALDTNGFADNTIVIFTSDNGPENGLPPLASQGGLRERKRSVHDGGTRVPFAVRWPGQAAAGLKINDPISQVDIFATIAAYLHVDLPDSTAPDSESFLNLLRGQKKRPEANRNAHTFSGKDPDLGLKTTDGMKFIDKAGTGGYLLYEQTGNNILKESPTLLSSNSNKAIVEAELVTLTGRNLLAELNAFRNDFTSTLFKRTPDNDVDGMSNAYEVQHQLDPDSPLDATQDKDGDGRSNFEEFIAGTDPNDASHYFRIISVTKSGGSASVKWPTKEGVTYKLYRSTDLKEWTYHSELIGDGSDRTVVVDIALIGLEDEDKLFFRVSADFSN